MKLRMLVAGLSVAVLVIGISLQSNANPWRRHGYWGGPHIAVRVYPPVPPVFVPPAPVIVHEGYYGYHRPHCRPRYYAHGYGYSHHGCGHRGYCR